MNGKSIEDISSLEKAREWLMASNILLLRSLKINMELLEREAIYEEEIDRYENELSSIVQDNNFADGITQNNSQYFLRNIDQTLDADDGRLAIPPINLSEIDPIEFKPEITKNEKKNISIFLLHILGSIMQDNLDMKDMIWCSEYQNLFELVTGVDENTFLETINAK